MTDRLLGDPPRKPGDIVAFHDHGPSLDGRRVSVLAGLGRNPKSLAGQMLCDHRSAAFRRLTRLPEYYFQRAELEILHERGAAISGEIGSCVQLVDLGRGNSAAVASLLDMLDRPWGYVAVDSDADPLLEDARQVQQDHPRLWVEAVRTDMRTAVDLPPNAGGGRRIAYLPGAAIGYCDPAEALDLLSLWARELGVGSRLLVSVDLRKSMLILESAFDDAQGCNAAIALEILGRLNREFGADFDDRMFEHRVRFDADRGVVKVYLVSRGAQTVRFGGEEIAFAAHEELHITDSWTYSNEDFQALARGAGFRPVEVWRDARSWISLHLLEVG